MGAATGREWERRGQGAHSNWHIAAPSPGCEATQKQLEHLFGDECLKANNNEKVNKNY